MGRIYLVRHGQSADNAAGILGGRRDSELTALGREQAKKAAEGLAGESIDRIYSSPLKRAFGTARVIADQLNIADIATDERLMERDFGILSGKPYSEIDNFASEIFQSGDVRYFLDAEGAEDYPTLFSRCEAVIREIYEKHLDENILLVTHGDAGQMIRAAYYDWSWEEGLHAPNFGNTDVFELTEAKLLYEKNK